MDFIVVKRLRGKYRLDQTGYPSRVVAIADLVRFTPPAGQGWQGPLDNPQAKSAGDIFFSVERLGF